MVPCILASALYEDVNEAQLPYFAWLGILLQGVVPPIHALIRAATRVTICGDPIPPPTKLTDYIWRKLGAESNTLNSSRSIAQRKRGMFLTPAGPVVSFTTGRDLFWGKALTYFNQKCTQFLARNASLLASISSFTPSVMTSRFEHACEILRKSLHLQHTYEQAMRYTMCYSYHFTLLIPWGLQVSSSLTHNEAPPPRPSAILLFG